VDIKLKIWKIKIYLKLFLPKLENQVEIMQEIEIKILEIVENDFFFSLSYIKNYFP
jgi:hypothetical protein